MKSKRWFTLIELVIVMAILGILFVLLLRTYNRISTMVFRVQQEKEVAQEVLQISQIVQNLADRNTIDYSKYAADISGENLTATKWITSMLYLSGSDGEVKIYTQGEWCIDPALEYTLTGSSWSGCSLYAEIWWQQRNLVNTKKVFITKAVFKVIPFASEEQYLADDSLCEGGNYLACFNAPWFRMIFKIYSANYGRQRATHVVIPFQQFF